MYFAKQVLAVVAAFSIAAIPGWTQAANSRPAPSAATNASTSKAMGNADVIALATAGLPDDIVIAKIHAAPLTNFDTSLDGLKGLKAANVSDAVIRAMIDPHAAIATSTPAPALSPTPVAQAAPSGLPTEDGVYYMKRGVYTEIEPDRKSVV